MKFIKFLFSGTFMGILLIIFAISMGYATFIENDYGTSTAKLLIYNATWFEAIMVLMVINFSGMIFTRQLYRKSKLNALLMHVSFIIIIIGAGITRYYGFEGIMHIREGETSNQFLSSETFIHYQLKENNNIRNILEPVILAPINTTLYKENIDFQDRDITVELDRFIPNAVEMLHPEVNGHPYLSLVAAMHGNRMNLYIREGETKYLGNLGITFGDSSVTEGIQIIRKGGDFYMRASSPIFNMDMSSGKVDEISGEGFQPVEMMTIYTVKGLNFVLSDFKESAEIQYMPGEENQGNAGNVARVNVTVDDQSETVFLRGGRGIAGNVRNFNVDGVEIAMSVGSQAWKLPFSLKLNDFVLERYPGSDSPSSFESKITLIDEEDNVEKPYRIFMNNILAHKGYRFYQSSYDQDERGTVLSVNHDRLGTIVTYTGYFLLFLTLILALFLPKTRFVKLLQQLNEIHIKRKQLATLVIIMVSAFFSLSAARAQNPANDLTVIDKDHAEDFGKLLVQNRDGRIIPLNTGATNILVKIYKKASYEGFNANQVILGMLAFPQEWQQTPLIKVYDENVQEMIGIDQDYAAYSDLLDNMGRYKLKSQVDEAYSTNPAQRSKLDKEVIYVDERMNVAFMAFNASFLRIYPIPDHPRHKWVDPAARVRDVNREDSLFIKTSFEKYLAAVRQGTETGNYAQADEILQSIKDFQRKHGAAIVPPQSKTNLEVLYNKLNIFKSLFPVYMTVGMILLALFLGQLFKPSLEFRTIINIFFIILGIAFLAHTVGLGIRWYISGHAPWSNGYESMIYIAWATMLAGFLFFRKSAMTLSVTSILAGITLLTAHMSWMNPEITNLVPVLKSYWLTLHVSTITASYGFLGLGCMLGFLNLSIMIFRNKNNILRVNLTIRELTYIIEMSLMAGLVLLVIGNFLGGIWANESWGRYWGWDPKETWSLITIIVYTFILHMRLIPGMKNLFSTNFGAMIGFGSVLMTYFGVNYYLSGLHSYAQGDPVPIPNFVYYLLFAIALVSILAAFNDVKMKGAGVDNGTSTDEE